MLKIIVKYKYKRQIYYYYYLVEVMEVFMKGSVKKQLL